MDSVQHNIGIYNEPKSLENEYKKSEIIYE